jgi:predicted amidohydrolase
MRIAALQFDVRRGEVEQNLARVKRGLERAHAGEVELVLCPEMWPTSFPESGADLERELAATERALGELERLSRELSLAVGGSSFARGAQARAGEPPVNRLTLFDRGARVLEYDKVHLFSPTAETEVFSAGDAPPETIELRGARVSGLVCYDLRFPELWHRPFQDGVELLLVPAQWPKPRDAHFKALVAGVAAANQCFVLACNRTGRETVGRRELVLDFPGNSLVVAPSGEVLAEGRGEDGLLVADVDLELARELKRRVPVAKDRRDELYARWTRQG